MQHFYAYTQKPSGNKASYKTLFSFFGKLLLIISLAFLVMMINISKSTAQPGSKENVGKNESSLLLHDAEKTTSEETLK